MKKSPVETWVTSLVKELVKYTGRTLIIKDRILDGEDLSGMMHKHTRVG